MKIIIPMAGLGTRFSSTGTTTPKPLIEIAGKYMFEWALQSVTEIHRSELIFILLKYHDIEFGLSSKIYDLNLSNTKIITLEEPTEGQLMTVLASKKHINSNEDILIIPTDTYVISDIHNQILNNPVKCKGIISVKNMPGSQWSFAKTNKFNQVIQVAEKTRISSFASTGMYYFSNGTEFLNNAEEIISAKEKSKGEYYIIPIYQKYIDKGQLININIATQMWDMGTPESAKYFEDNFETKN